VHSCVLVDPKTSCGLMDPENHKVLGPPKHMRFWSSSGSIKTHEFLRGENFENPNKPHVF
jgi:hypothetical protein